MSLTFHDGTHALYRNYSTSPWNDVSLLMLNPAASRYDKWLMDNYNTQATITEMFDGNGVKNCYPFGVGKSKLSEYVAAKDTGVIVIKGLHQWKSKPNGYDYQLHLTLGFEGQLWHLDANYYDKSQKVVLSTTCTAGDRVTAVDNDGFKRVGSR